MAMFGKNGREDGMPAMPSSSSGSSGGGSARRGTGFSVLGADVVITGNVAAQADLHVEGRVEGDLDCGNLVQGADSVIRGPVRATSARIAGTIEGSVAIRQLVVEADARIVGDVEYDTIALENGAHIDGRLKHMSAQTVIPAGVPTPAIAAARVVKVVDVESDAAE